MLLTKALRRVRRRSTTLCRRRGHLSILLDFEPADVCRFPGEEQTLGGRAAYIEGPSYLLWSHVPPAADVLCATTTLRPPVLP